METAEVETNSLISLARDMRQSTNDFVGELEKNTNYKLQEQAFFDFVIKADEFVTEFQKVMAKKD